MISHTARTLILIFFSMLIAAVLEVLPLPGWASFFRPEWAFLILIFWLIAQPQYVGVLTAFFLGIYMDLLMGTVLGQHAFAFTAAAYFLSQYHYRFKFFLLRQQLIVVFILTFLQLSLQFFTLKFFDFTVGWGNWVPAITSIFIWPWFYSLFREKNEMIGGR